MSFLNLLKTDKIINLCISKIKLETNDIKDLFEILSKLNNLKFLIFDVIMENLFDQFLNAVLKNKQLIGIVYGNNDNLAEVDDKIKENDNLKFFHYEPNINLFI